MFTRMLAKRVDDGSYGVCACCREEVMGVRRRLGRAGLTEEVWRRRWW
jgi:hypothetical protein